MAATLAVQPGDTLWALAARYTGDGRAWRELVAANPHKPTTGTGTFRTMQPGERLVRPLLWPAREPETGDLSSIEKTATSPQPMGQTPPKTVVGDPGLPFTWTRDGLETVQSIAHALGISADDLKAVWFGESGLIPTIIGKDYKGNPIAYGLAQVIPAYAPASWRPGTVQAFVTQPVTFQLQGLYQIYKSMADRFLQESMGSRARKLGISTAGMVYAMNFLPARAAKATSAQSVLTRRGESEYDTPPNPNLDIGNKGYITLSDMDRRAQAMLKTARAKYPALFGITTEPRTLASAFGPYQGVWYAVSGTPADTSLPKTKGTGDDKMVYETGHAATDTGLIVLGIGAAIAGYIFLRKRKR